MKSIWILITITIVAIVSIDIGIHIGKSWRIDAPIIIESIEKADIIDDEGIIDSEGAIEIGCRAGVPSSTWMPGHTWESAATRTAHTASNALRHTTHQPATNAWTHWSTALLPHTASMDTAVANAPYQPLRTCSWLQTEWWTGLPTSHSWEGWKV